MNPIICRLVPGLKLDNGGSGYKSSLSTVLLKRCLKTLISKTLSEKSTLRYIFDAFTGSIKAR